MVRKLRAQVLPDQPRTLPGTGLAEAVMTVLGDHGEFVGLVAALEHPAAATALSEGGSAARRCVGVTESVVDALAVALPVDVASVVAQFKPNAPIAGEGASRCESDGTFRGIK
ncbi:MAG: hypothetical protein KAJ55_16375 [Anaerolineales bacterium]|nr:hypothetical protein [Anaerolineales bacterium]